MIEVIACLLCTRALHQATQETCGATAPQAVHDTNRL